MNAQVSHDWDGLRQLCARLRAPGGCPWDRAQTIQTLTPYLLEETHELLEAIAAGEDSRIAEEIGDLLYLLVSLVTIAEEEQRFSFDTVATQTVEKLVRRHPQIFGSAPESAGSGSGRPTWEGIKHHEAKSRGEARATLASFGFDWPGPEAVLEKLDEERGELSQVLATGDRPADRGAVREELGDLLFTVVNLSRHLGEDPEQTLRRTVNKFRDRFARMEDLLQQDGTRLGAADLATMERAWQRAKSQG
jgi:uncharacterized protein YabN with tetrapyrrole methylase and pyrophosphatase domain